MYIKVTTRNGGTIESGLVAMKYGSNKSLCPAYYDECAEYDAEVESDVEVTANGVRLNFHASVYSGSVDGYDRPSGTDYYNVDEFNLDWLIVESDE